MLRARSPRRESGQALVEFALVLPVLMLLVMGIVDFGFAFNQWNTAQNAAREGARIAAVSSNVPTIKNRALVTGDTIKLLDPEISVSCNRPSPGNNTFVNCNNGLQGNGGTFKCTNGSPDDCGGGYWAILEGDIVQVNVVHAYRFVTPLPRLIGLGSTIDLKASIQTRFEG